MPVFRRGAPTLDSFVLASQLREGRHPSSLPALDTKITFLAPSAPNLYGTETQP